jgi:hypothetical protein
MSVHCEDRERIFLDGAPEEWAALEVHAAGCAACAEELRAWRELSAAASELRNYQEDPALWSRIAVSLEQRSARQSAGAVRRENRWDFLRLGWRMPLIWQTSLAAALVLALTGSGVYLYVQHQRSVADGNAANNPFLNDRGLAEVQRTEQAYMQAIDRLAAEATSQLDASSSPLMDSYREKLLVLDSAIEELRLEEGQNPGNAHLRYQLLAMYQQKQRTLQDILESKP